MTRQKTYLQSLATSFIATTTLISTPTFAGDPSHLEHPHSAGATMVQFDYMHMSMNGLVQNGESVSGIIAPANSDGYFAEPTSMSMDMFMLMPMYNFTRELSGMVMLNYLVNTMDMKTNSVTQPDQTMKTYGFGDTEIDLSYKFFEDSFAASFSLSLPTGSITEDMNMRMVMYHASMGHAMDMDMSMRAPYMMQLGSGTYDVTPALTYLGAYYSLRYGAQTNFTYRIGQNSEGYTLGNKVKAIAWIRKPFGIVTLDSQLALTRWGAIKGSDPLIEQTMRYTSTVSYKTSPDAIPSNYGGTRADLSIGARMPIGPLSLGVSTGLPVYQKLNGLQMPTTWTLTTSLSAMF